MNLFSSEIPLDKKESYLNLLEETFPGIKNNIIRCESLGFKWGGEGRLFIREENGVAVSHVGYFESPALIDSSWYKIGAIHAICTHPLFRKRGLASQLILDALKWAKKRCHAVILFTDLLSFYERLSFHTVQEHRFHLPCQHIRGNQTLRSIQSPVDNALFLRCFRKRAPLSQYFWIQDHGVIASFNALFATDPIFRSFYYSSTIDGLLSYVLEDKTLHLYDVVASKIPSLECILDHFSSPIENIYFYFSPDRFTQNAIAEPYHYDDIYLMVHGSIPCSHPFMVAPFSRC